MSRILLPGGLGLLPGLQILLSNERDVCLGLGLGTNAEAWLVDAAVLIGPFSSSDKVKIGGKLPGRNIPARRCDFVLLCSGKIQDAGSSGLHLGTYSFRPWNAVNAALLLEANSTALKACELPHYRLMD